MKILGKVCAWVAVIMLTFQGTIVLIGYPISGISAGVELLVIAVWLIMNALVCFENPTHHIEVDTFISYESGEIEHFRSDKIGSVSKPLPQHDGRIDGISVVTKEVTDHE